MAEAMIRVGVIGANARYGWGMRPHLPALLSLPEYELTAVCTAHPETAEESAKKYGASRPPSLKRWLVKCERMAAKGKMLGSGGGCDGEEIPGGAG